MDGRRFRKAKEAVWGLHWQGHEREMFSEGTLGIEMGESRRFRTATPVGLLGKAHEDD